MFHSTLMPLKHFLFVPNDVTKKGSHIRDSIDLKRTMIFVVIALVPALLFGIYNVGYQHFLSHGESVGFWQMFFYGFMKVLPIIVVSYVVSLTIEFAAAQIKGHPLNEGVLVTGILIPMIMPPDIPLWMVAVATAFSIIFAKEVFGGTGMNFLNPALVARAFIFFAYPSAISGDKVWIAEKADAFSGATSLAQASAPEFDKIASVQDLMIGFVPGSIGETSKIAILIGAVFLVFVGVGSLRIILSSIVGLLSTALLFNVIGLNPYMDMPFYYHLLLEDSYLVQSLWPRPPFRHRKQPKENNLWFSHWSNNGAYPSGESGIPRRNNVGNIANECFCSFNRLLCGRCQR